LLLSDHFLLFVPIKIVAQGRIRLLGKPLPPDTLCASLPKIIFQDDGVAGISFKPNIENVAEERDQSDNKVTDHIEHHPRPNIGGKVCLRSRADDHHSKHHYYSLALAVFDK